MVKYFKYFGGIITSVMLFVPSLSQGQILIEADTLSFDCRDAYVLRTNMNQFVISSDDEYRESQFTNSREEGCLPFANIDFNKSILVGFRYRGSNCDKGVERATISKTGNQYLIQFTTYPPNVCRDLSFRIAWFVLNKPSKDFEFAFKRLSKN
jgi:hypothetical protein